MHELVIKKQEEKLVREENVRLKMDIEKKDAALKETQKALDTEHAGRLQVEARELQNQETLDIYRMALVTMGFEPLGPRVPSFKKITERLPLAGVIYKRLGSPLTPDDRRNPEETVEKIVRSAREAKPPR